MQAWSAQPVETNRKRPLRHSPRLPLRTSWVTWLIRSRMQESRDHPTGIRTIASAAKYLNTKAPKKMRPTVLGPFYAIQMAFRESPTSEIKE